MRGEVRAGEARPHAGRRPGARRAHRHGLVDRGADRPRPGPRPLGVAAGAGLAGRRLRRPEVGADARRLRRRARPARATSSTPRSPRASPWPRCTRPRAWSGTPSSCAACRRGRCRSPTPTTPAEVEEERRLLYVGITRARKHLWVSWALARNPGGQARASRRGSWPACAPSRSPTAPTPAPAEQRAPRGKKAAVCKQCQTPLASSRERNRGYCDDCPVPYDEELFESLRAWRKEQADAQSVPAFVVFSDATLEALAEVKPTDAARALQSINGIGAAKLEKYADDLLAPRRQGSSGNGSEDFFQNSPLNRLRARSRAAVAYRSLIHAHRAHAGPARDEGGAHMKINTTMTARDRDAVRRSSRPPSRRSGWSLPAAAAPVSTAPRRSPACGDMGSRHGRSGSPPGVHRSPESSQLDRQPPGRGTHTRDPRPLCFSETPAFDRPQKTNVTRR